MSVPTSASGTASGSGSSSGGGGGVRPLVTKKDAWDLKANKGRFINEKLNPSNATGALEDAKSKRGLERDIKDTMLLNYLHGGHDAKTGDHRAKAVAHRPKDHEQIKPCTAKFAKLLKTLVVNDQDRGGITATTAVKGLLEKATGKTIDGLPKDGKIDVADLLAFGMSDAWTSTCGVVRPGNDPNKLKGNYLATIAKADGKDAEEIKDDANAAEERRDFRTMDKRAAQAFLQTIDPEEDDLLHYKQAIHQPNPFITRANDPNVLKDVPTAAEIQKATCAPLALPFFVIIQGTNTITETIDMIKNRQRLTDEQMQALPRNARKQIRQMLNRLRVTDFDDPSNPPKDEDRALFLISGDVTRAKVTSYIRGVMQGSTEDPPFPMLAFSNNAAEAGAFKMVVTNTGYKFEQTTPNNEGIKDDEPHHVLYFYGKQVLAGRTEMDKRLNVDTGLYEPTCKFPKKGGLQGNYVSDPWKLPLVTLAEERKVEMQNKLKHKRFGVTDPSGQVQQPPPPPTPPQQPPPPTPPPQQPQLQPQGSSKESDAEMPDTQQLGDGDEGSSQASRQDVPMSTVQQEVGDENKPGERADLLKYNADELRENRKVAFHENAKKRGNVSRQQKRQQKT